MPLMRKTLSWTTFLLASFSLSLALVLALCVLLSDKHVLPVLIPPIDWNTKVFRIKERVIPRVRINNSSSDSIHLHPKQASDHCKISWTGPDVQLQDKDSQARQMRRHRRSNSIDRKRNSYCRARLHPM